MLTGRNVIIVTVAIAVISLLGIVIELALPPDGGGLRSDSYGTHAAGYRGLFETLQEFKIPAERGLVPPDALLAKNPTVIFLAPDAAMLDVEPVYLERVIEWVRGGGHMIVALPKAEREQYTRGKKGVMSNVMTSALMEKLGLGEVSWTFVDLLDPGDPTAPPRSKWGVQQRGPYLVVDVPVAHDGSLAELSGSVKELQLPKDRVQVLQFGAQKPDGTTTFNVAGKGSGTLAAAFPIGKGRLILVSEPEIMQNILLRENDNAVFTAKIMTSMGGPLVFDEFYHGVTVRGNPFFLLTRHPFGLLAFVLLFASGIWIWRSSVHLGPPADPSPPSRRSLGEYVNAMARMFYRGDTRKFLLTELRDGTIWHLRKKLGLHPKAEHRVDDLIKVLARKNPDAAAQLQTALEQVDETLRDAGRASEERMVYVARNLSKCL